MPMDDYIYRADEPIKKPPKLKGGRPKGAKDLKPRKKRQDFKIKRKKKEQDEYNRNLIAFVNAVTPSEPLDPKDVPEMEKRFEHYLKMCAKYGQKVGNLGAYSAIGISRQQAYDWEHKTKTLKERQEFIKKVKRICSTYREAMGSDAKINPVLTIFWQKNFDGLRDQTDVVVSDGNALSNLDDTESLESKYMALSQKAKSLNQPFDFENVIDAKVEEKK